MRSPFIALIWDFDNTLIQGCMQEPLFAHYGIDGKAFWKEKEELAAFYRRQGVRVNTETLYLNLFLQKKRQGLFPGLTAETLVNFGNAQRLCPGMPQFLDTVRNLVAQHSKYNHMGLAVEHYIVSNGMAAIIRGSSLAEKTEAIWGCEFAGSAGDSMLDEAVYTVDSTTKTRILFEISKGIHLDVNASLAEERRRIPFQNMIYIADGQSDIPAFSLVEQRGGCSIGVYHRNQSYTLLQAKQLYRDGRISAFVEADYTEQSPAFAVITQRIIEIAERICEN